MAVTVIPNVQNWTVAPQNGQAGYFTLMNTWLGQSTLVIASLQTAITAQNTANSEINALAIQVANNAIIATGLANFQGVWNNAITYSKGQSASVGGLYYISKVDSNLNHLVTDTNYWIYNPINDKVNNSGNETIAGIKTFSSSPIVPAPTDGDQVANKDYADLKVALADFTGSNFASGPNGGYQKLPSGLIIQWGKALSSGTATYNATATLPIAFPIEGFVGVGTIQAAGIPQTYTVQVGAVSKTQIPMTTLQSTAIIAGIIVNWVAIGY